MPIERIRKNFSKNFDFIVWGAFPVISESFRPKTCNEVQLLHNYIANTAQTVTNDYFEWDESIYVWTLLIMPKIWPQKRVSSVENKGRSLQLCQILDRIMSIYTRNWFKSRLNRSFCMSARFSLVRDRQIWQERLPIRQLIVFFKR